MTILKMKIFTISYLIQRVHKLLMIIKIVGNQQNILRSEITLVPISLPGMRNLLPTIPHTNPAPKHRNFCF